MLDIEKFDMCKNFKFIGIPHLLLAIFIISLSGCNREEPLPELGVEGVYLIVRMIDGEVLEANDLPYDNVYWFFADRTFQKARLTDGELAEASGTFSPVPHPAGESGEGLAYELTFAVGEELIEGCHADREIIIHVTDVELLHEGAPCGAPDIYYTKADFGGSR
ncbi:hypothetical protein [Anditalea andensis]|uniref:Uncharacterized protein n=1 Tax=Anditalea andensis TaxID=1048983 RepID=A0A074L0G6_9BACT|nr:hypothetical protein [Anditalea andensis]KEO74624.1 hypothetical protein EL17_02820 [Anditalea andensis]